MNPNDYCDMSLRPLCKKPNTFDSFDLEAFVKFSAFAKPTSEVRGELEMHFLLLGMCAYSRSISFIPQIHSMFNHFVDLIQ